MEEKEKKNKNYKKKNKNYSNYKQSQRQNTNNFINNSNQNQIVENNTTQEKKEVSQIENMPNTNVEPIKKVVQAKDIPNKDVEPIKEVPQIENISNTNAESIKEVTQTEDISKVEMDRMPKDIVLETESISNRKIANEEEKKEVVEDYIADIYNTPYAKQSIKSAVNNKKEENLEETKEFTETIVSNEIREKLEEMKERQIRLEENPDIIRPPKKSHLSTILFLLIIFGLIGFILYHFTTYNHKIKEKIVTKEKIVEVVDDNYVFLGDSITEKYDIGKYFQKRNKNIINSGNSGNLTKDILNNMKKRVYDYNPSVVFLLIGVNDVNKDVDTKEVINNIKKIVTNIKENRPLATIYVESIYPTGSKERNETIIEVNKEVKEFCEKQNITFINLYDDLVNKDKVIDGKYTKDGIHLSDEGYDVVSKKLEQYIKEEK